MTIQKFLLDYTSSSSFDQVVGLSWTTAEVLDVLRLYKEELDKRSKVYSQNSKKHGMAGQKFYNKWINLKRSYLAKSCSAYPSFGGRGIEFNPEWLDFMCFKKDMYDSYLKACEAKEDPHVCLKDPAKSPSVENCHWGELSERLTNSRSASGIKATSPAGEVFYHKSVAELMKKHNLSHSGISQVISGKNSNHKGWKFEKDNSRT